MLIVSYPLMDIGEIMLSAVDGSTFNIADIFMHHGSRKTIVSSNTGQDLARVIDERCIVHDLSHGDTIITSCMLSRGLYKLTNYSRNMVI